MTPGSGLHCMHCLYYVKKWQAPLALPQPYDNVGECRRRSPVVLQNGKVEFPIMNGFVDWCGDILTRAEVA